MATAETSFRISIEAISAILRSFSEPPTNGIPSTTISGLVDELIELVPLIRAVGGSPGTDEVWVIVTPATDPSIAWRTLVTGNCDSRSFGTEAPDPVI